MLQLIKYLHYDQLTNTINENEFYQVWFGEILYSLIIFHCRQKIWRYTSSEMHIINYSKMNFMITWCHTILSRQTFRTTAQWDLIYFILTFFASALEISILTLAQTSSARSWSLVFLTQFHSQMPPTNRISPLCWTNIFHILYSWPICS